MGSLLLVTWGDRKFASFRVFEMPLLLIGLLSLALGTLALTRGRLPVTRQLSWRGSRAKWIGWCCWSFGLLCIAIWVALMFPQYAPAPH